MTREQLLRMPLEDLLNHIQSQITLARMVAEQNGLLESNRDGAACAHVPLLTIGDFDIWSREIEGEDNKMDPVVCRQCGVPNETMMYVKGPYAFETGSPIRHFCSIRCFWNWVYEKINEGEAIASKLPRRRIDPDLSEN